MKAFIKQKLREAIIDNQNMNNGTESLCDKMSVATYAEGIRLIIKAIGKPEQNPKLWQRIAQPLNDWKQANNTISQQKHTAANGSHISNTTDGMSGDSMVDESNTWWTAIQTTICEQGNNFV